ncbi:MAG: class I SAM-dependent RNA methyltransferase [Vicinamibacterales bacterium]
MSDAGIGASLTLRIEKAVAGGEMLARHDGQVVLVAGAIPGELVRARMDRVVARTARASVVDVLEPSPSRRPGPPDPACGGQAFAHIVYPAQTALKAAIVQDAWERIARLAWPGTPAVAASPEHGYRMRARLHGRDGRIGFLREGTHQVCGPDAGGQLLPGTVAWVQDLERQAATDGVRVSAIELTEDVSGAVRAAHLDVSRTPSAALLRVAGAAGPVSWSPAPSDTSPRGRRPGGAARHGGPVTGDASLVDAVVPAPGASGVPLRRHARAFFQGNRYLLAPLVQHVVAASTSGPVLDLYAGVGVFGLGAAAVGRGPVVCVEGDAVSGADLVENAAPFADVQTVHAPVERYVSSPAASRFAPRTVIVDPPRTGLLPEAARAVGRLASDRIVFVSCDPATFARDAKLLDEGGFSLSSLTVFDLFPNTAHIESVGVFDRR